MTPAKVIARLRRLAEDWRREEARLCEQFGDAIAPQSMRARQIKDTQAIDAAIETVDRLEAAEKERDTLRAKIEQMERQEPIGEMLEVSPHNYELMWYRPVPFGAKLYTLPGARTQGEEK